MLFWVELRREEGEADENSEQGEDADVKDEETDKQSALIKREEEEEEEEQTETFENGEDADISNKRIHELAAPDGLDELLVSGRLAFLAKHMTCWIGLEFGKLRTKQMVSDF